MHGCTSIATARCLGDPKTGDYVCGLGRQLILGANFTAGHSDDWCCTAGSYVISREAEVATSVAAEAAEDMGGVVEFLSNLGIATRIAIGAAVLLVCALGYAVGRMGYRSSRRRRATKGFDQIGTDAVDTRMQADESLEAEQTQWLDESLEAAGPRGSLFIAGAAGAQTASRRDDYECHLRSIIRTIRPPIRVVD